MMPEHAAARSGRDVEVGGTSVGCFNCSWYAVISAGLLFSMEGRCAQENKPPAPAVVSGGESGAQSQVVVTGSISDIEARRNSIAGKVIVGRKAIEESGVSNVYELLKRQPSVTVSANGRLGLMGMPGYTQILVDGVAAASGKSPLDTDVVHVERIEIVKSAVAEFGPYGSAGTINIVSRKVARRNKTQLRSGISAGTRDAGANVSWEANSVEDSSPFTYAVQFSASRTSKKFEERSELWNTDTQGLSKARQYNAGHQASQTSRMSGGATFGWRHGSLDSITFDPGIMAWSIGTQSRDNTTWISGEARPVESYQDLRTPLTSISLPVRWSRTFPDRSQFSLWFSPTRFVLRKELDRNDVFSTHYAERRVRAERSTRGADFLKADYTTKIAAKHTVKLGATIGRNSEESTFSSRINDASDISLASLGFDRDLVDRKYSFFVQDSAQLSKTIGGNFGLAFEKRDIRIQEGSFRSKSSYSLMSPSANLTWRADENSKNQIRLGVARTFTAPFSDQLTLRPEINPLAPCSAARLCGSNSAEFADRVGNPGLRPEKSLGLNLAIERYIADDSVLTLELFARRITDVIGSDLVLLDAPWAQAPRYVLRPENLGTAWSRGASIEIQLLTSDIWADLPKVELQGAVTVARSKISTIPGPDNRIADQSPWSAKLSGAYTFNTFPLKINIDMSFTPSTWIRSSVARRIFQDKKFDLDMDGAWTFSPNTKLRFNLNQIASSSVRSRNDFFNTNGDTASRFASKRRSPSLGLRLEQKF